jgi:hypothetical protein
MAEATVRAAEVNRAGAIQAAETSRQGAVEAAKVSRSGTVTAAKIAARALLGGAAVTGVFGVAVVGVQGHFATEQAKIETSVSARALSSTSPENVKVSYNTWRCVELGLGTFKVSELWSAEKTRVGNIVTTPDDCVPGMTQQNNLTADDGVNLLLVSYLHGKA